MTRGWALARMISRTRFAARDLARASGARCAARAFGPDLLHPLGSLTIALCSYEPPSCPMKHLRIHTRDPRPHLLLIDRLSFRIDRSLPFPSAYRTG